MRKNFLISSIFLFIIFNNGYANGLENLARRVSDAILNYFTGKGNIRTSIIKFENFSDLSDMVAQKYYQLLVSNLESHPKLNYTDLMINFNKKRGEFNLNRTDKLNYLIYIKLIKNMDKLGIGTAIFSRSLDKIVYIKYFEEVFSTGDRDIYETLDYGFKGSGFSKQIEIESNKNLLDFKSIINPDEEHIYFFYYPEKIEIFKVEEDHFKKFFSFKLNWGRSYYQVLNYEGKLSLFYRGELLYLTVGSNFSTSSQIFCYKNNQWQKFDTTDFVPIRLVRLNGIDYLAGGCYDEGKNIFKEKIILVPFISGELRKESRLEKKTTIFYDLDFSTYNQEDLEGVHLIDFDYNYRFLAGDFEGRTMEIEKRGSSLAALDGQWLAISDYSTTDDTLYFYKIEGGSKRLVYKNRINGQVIFISDGTWKSYKGFWVYVKKMKNEHVEYSLQFWSKNYGK